METITNFFDAIWQWVTVDVWETLSGWARFIWQSIQIWVYELAVDGIEWMQGLITGSTSFSGDVFERFRGFYDGLPDTVIGVLTLLNVPAGLAILFAAFVLRFTIRLILAVLF